MKARPRTLGLMLAAFGIIGRDQIPFANVPDARRVDTRRVSYSGKHPLARKARSGKSRKTTPLEPRVRFNGATPTEIGRRRLTRRQRKALKAKAARQ